MQGNVVGEPFETFVANQIKRRQTAQFGGYGTSFRNDDQLKYLTNRNAWVKLASSVSVLGGQQPNRLEKIFSNATAQAAKFPGTKLAESAILFNTLSSYVSGSSSSPLKQFRAGISTTNTLWDDNNAFAYGIGGTNFGIQPPPGIVSVQVDSINRGSIRKANVALKAHNRFQFDLIELLYLRLGFTMMLEWGWDKYIDNETGDLLQVGNTIIETEWFTSTGISQFSMLSKIQKMREKYDGNYDGFFGKVSNFTWNFNSDGTYDITIDLITLGDVIESIKTNAASKQQLTNSISEITQFESFEEAIPVYGNIAEASTLSALGSYLFERVVYMKNSGAFEITVESNGQKFVEYFAITPKKVLIERATVFNPAKYNFDAEKNFYYIRLGQLLLVLQNFIVPQVKNGQDESPQIYLSSDALLNLSAYYPNQISLDPRVCVFKTDDALNEYSDITGINSPTELVLTKNGTTLNPYIIVDSTSKIKYGALMNLYMNIEFISGLLISNGGPNQELSLFKFLQDLCNGINDALGGVNKLEPVIKEDFTVVFIDQTLSLPVNDTVELEIYGYNTVEQTSNFVKDIKFVSKITPQLASMISIGATATDSSVSELDGTAFSKWNENLIDRFTEKIVEPEITPLQLPTPENAADRATYEAEFNQFPPDAGFWGNFLVNYGLTEPSLITRKITDPFYIGAGLYNKVMGFETFWRYASAYRERRRLQGTYRPEDLKNLVDKNYGFYLTTAFGGTSNTVSVVATRTVTTGADPYFPTITLSQSIDTYNATVDSRDARYFEFDDTFVSQGKAAYKTYMNELNRTRFAKDNTPSSEVGFIPLSFDLVLDGISGIKIYNKLNINNSFLPSNYPESLRFIITKVNHNISNNSWDTSLSTISMPETKPYEYGLIPLPEPEPSGSTRYGAIVVDNIVGSLTPQPGLEGTLEPLKSLLAKYESFGGDYNAANQGTNSGCDGYSQTTNLTSLTFKEIRELMLLPSSPCDRRRVFAVGKYQTIPITLFGSNWQTDINGGKFKQLGFSENDLFSPQNQEKIGDALILNGIRTNLAAYVSGRSMDLGSFDLLSKAVQDTSMEWSSMPTIRPGVFTPNAARTNWTWNGTYDTAVDDVINAPATNQGISFYKNPRNGNKVLAKINVRQLVKILIQTRINYTSGAKVPKDIPTYYTQP